jgi:DNA-binding transcriptional LysR family regulator
MRRRNGTLDWSRARLLHEVSYDYWPDWINLVQTTPTLAATTKTPLAAPGGGAVRRSGRPIASDVAHVDVARGLFFSHTMLALDAAVEGQGVALSPPPLAERELARGALEVVDPRPFVPGTGIYLCWPRRQMRSLSKAATAFRDWVIEEARATQPLVERTRRARVR